MSIDDNHQNLSLIQQALEEHFDVISSTGEESVEELVVDCEPHIILLDIMLTDKSGYEICSQLKDKGLVNNTIIIFISSLSSLSDKLKAYEAGGDDYICKPVNLHELEYKLEAYEKRINKHRALANKVEEASQAAFASMQQSSQLGLLIEFFNHCLNIHTLKDLYEAVKTSVAKFGLNCAMEFRINQRTHQYPGDNISQLESEILDLGKRAKRVVSFGKNVLFNSSQCSLLIKQMPSEELQLGRLRDHFAILLAIIDSRLEYIAKEMERTRKRLDTIDALKTGIESNLSQVNRQVVSLETQLGNAFEQMQKALKEELSVLGVNKKFEAKINHILDQSKAQFDDIIDTSVNTDPKITDIEHLLAKLR